MITLIVMALSRILYIEHASLSALTGRHRKNPGPRRSSASSLLHSLTGEGCVLGGLCPWWWWHPLWMSSLLGCKVGLLLPLPSWCLWLLLVFVVWGVGSVCTLWPCGPVGGIGSTSLPSCIVCILHQKAS